MNRILQRLFLTITICISYSYTYAITPGYITAADLSYTCMGNNKYEVTLAVYAECDGEYKLENVNDYDVFVKSDSAGKAFQFKVTKVNSFEIKYYCESQLTMCQGGTNRGIRKYIYKGILDLSQYAKASDWKIYWRRDFRTSRMIHIFVPEKEPYYVETNLNNKIAACNNSPHIDGSAIFTACIDSISTYSLLAIDVDGDVLKYSIINPRNNATADLIYKPGFDKNSPLNLSAPLSITTTGTISFKPTIPNDFGITDILIEEYRNGIKIGSTTKGLQISTFSCINRKPSISNFPNSTTNSLIYCVGDTIKQAETLITSTDPDGNNVHFEQEQGPAGWFVSSSGKNAFAFVNKVTTLGDVGKNVFTLSAVDDGCPTIQKNTKTYTIEVATPPLFELGSNKTALGCPKTTITPTITGGSAPFTYQWFTFQRNYNSAGQIIGYTKLSNIGSSSSIDISNPGLVGLKVTDKNGCSFEDTTEYIPSLDASFTKQHFCLGSTTVFKDASTTLIGTIISRTWDLGDGSPIIINDSVINHIYAAVGEYIVTETVTNSVGCTQVVRRTIEICTIPPLVIQAEKECVKPSIYKDITLYPGKNCNGAYYNWYVNGVLEDGPSKHSSTVEIHYQDTNNVNITMEVVTVAECRGSVTQNFKINWDPKIRLIDKDGIEVPPVIGLNCSNGGSIAYTDILENPNGGTNYQWYKVSSSFKELTTNSFFKPDSIGTYAIIFQDQLGCDDTASFSLVYPVVTNFTYDPVCYPNDTMQFINKSTLLDNANSSIKWDFGDGTSIITDDQTNPKHKYPEKKDYFVTLSATDTSGCTSTITKKVFNTFLVDIHRIEPSIIANPICAQNILTGFSVDSLLSGQHIDSIFWNFDNGLGEQKYKFPEGKTVKFTYSSPKDSAIIKTRIIYNIDTAMHNKHCEYIPDSDTIFVVHPAFVGKIIPFRNCATDTAVFNFIKDKFEGDSNIKVKTWHWTLSAQNSGNYSDIINPIIPNPIQEEYTPSFKKYFKNISTTDYDIHLYAEDENGCKYGYRQPIKIGETALPNVFPIDTVCQGAVATIRLNSTNRTPSGLPALVSYYGMDANGDNTIARGNYESSSDTISINYVFDISGDIPLKLYMYEQTNVPSSTVYNQTTPTECRAVIYDTIHVRPTPLLKFVTDTVCAGNDYTHFTNLTKFIKTSSNPSDTVITGYTWDFGDNTTSTEKNPRHLFKSGGKQLVTLTAHTNNCSFSYTDSIYVKHKPYADFDITVPSRTPGDSTSVEADVPIHFINKSTDGTPDNSIGIRVPDGYSWSFGDGTGSFEKDPYHTYTDIRTYYDTLTVTNNEGCKASRIKVSDTDSRLELPNVFSPNNEGVVQNNVLGLIYKLIIELDEYKIYNRWGQVVFDAGNNLDAVWDGKYNGVDQEVGVYVAYVKAKGKYNKLYNFKKNITLLR